MTHGKINFKHPDKPFECPWISDKTRNKLKIKQKDFIILLYSKKFTRSQIARTLHLSTDSSYSKFQKIVRNTLSVDLEKIKELEQKDGESTLNSEN